METNEHDENCATPRAGGDIITKSASQMMDESDNDNAGMEAPQSGTRAGGDIITKGASQTEDEAGQ